MPADTLESPEIKAMPKPKGEFAGKIFRVLKDCGPWRKSDPEIGGKPSVFEYKEFVRLHPMIREKKTTDAKGEVVITMEPTPGINPATYHDSLLKRLIAMGRIVIDMNAKPTPTPLGPSNMSRDGIDPIEESTRQYVEHEKLREQQNAQRTPTEGTLLTRPGATVGA